MITLGLAFSSGLIALAGALLAQYQGFADVQVGIGMVVWGLASVIISESLVSMRNLGLTLPALLWGQSSFGSWYAMALRWGLNPNDPETYYRYLCICSFDTSQPAGQVAEKGRRKQSMLEIRGISKTFNAGTPNEVRALQNIDLTVDEDHSSS